MNIIKPSPVKNGAAIGFLSVCGPIYEPERIEKAKKYFENKGCKVVISDTTYTSKDFLSADDKTRVRELEHFFKSPEIDAILCTRGGYGAIRIIDKIDYDIIRNNPKFFGGFSDATALLTAISKHAGIETYHCPMPYPDFGGENVSELTEKSLFEAFESKFADIELAGETYHQGEGEGILWGGNLATLASMVGFDFIPDEKFILFIEDVNEPAYKIDRYLTQLSFLTAFKNNISGLVIGELTGLDEPEYADNIFREIGKKYNIPAIAGLKTGHVKDKLTLPIGRHCKVSTIKKTIVF